MSDGAMRGKGVPVRLDKVSFSYGEAPLTFDVAFAAAEITAIMGPSGSGKSTLLNLVAGFETPQSGRVLIGGADVGAAPPAARPVSMVFQENNLFGHLSVEQWLTPQPGWRAAENNLTIRRLGIKVGSSDGVIRKLS